MGGAGRNRVEFGMAGDGKLNSNSGSRAESGGCSPDPDGSGDEFEEISVKACASGI